MFGWMTHRKRLAVASSGLAFATAGSLGGIALAGSKDAPVPADPIPARMLGADVPVPISPTLLQTTNGWVAGDGHNLTAVYAGSAGKDSTMGRIVVVRQDLDVGEQSVDSVDVGETGAVTITSAPLGTAVETSAQTAKIAFSSADGSRGTLDLGSDDTLDLTP